eukprot:13803681-Ditylum_brightwellii.AAC.1
MAEEKQTTRKAIITLLTKRILVTAAWKQEMNITKKCSDRNLIKLIRMDMEKYMASFAEKIGVQNMQSPNVRIQKYERLTVQKLHVLEN